MKIAICSDLHLEFAPVDIHNPGDVDVLILSGDILVESDLEEYDATRVEFETMSRRSIRYHEFFQQVCSEFPQVIYVAGNHEHYHGDFATTIAGLRAKLAHYKNLNILDREIFCLQDVVFVGGTLWTDMNKRDAITLHAMKSMMNDFRCVKNSNRVVHYRAVVAADKPVGMTDTDWLSLSESARTVQLFKQREATFSPEDAVEDHEKMLGYISLIYQDLPPEKRMVVVGHHTPSHLSCHPKYSNDQIMNGGYHSDLSEFILDRPRICLWTHGHTHERFDYQIGDTRVVCNPRGYAGHEQVADDFQLKVVEI
jgi:predicted phosphodiesterase